MDEAEFQRILQLFPVVRSRDYNAESESSRQSTSRSAEDELKEWQDAWDEGDKKEVENQGIDPHDAFWEKLKSAAVEKVGPAEAERFCRAFQQIHKKLVYEELSSDAARSFINSSRNSKE
ncbi:Octanoyltransferase [Quillaja saponaria]|uniref:Octanoyltransferase n=1 Tax=Quillaja saponaria TaxID=32244 RepID=A0AAD7PQZ1_QUISA|nr:Octanoyltransferase [Quillaja saponaria]